MRPYRSYVAPRSLRQALQLKRELGRRARACAGGTDLLLELERGRAPAPALLDLTRIPGLATIERQANGRFRLGPLVTHNQCVADPALAQRAYPLARACWEVGSPPLRNRATVVGNVVTASPANDAIAPLNVLNAQVTMESAQRGARSLPLAAFITGYRATALEADELVTGIELQGLDAHERGLFVKLGLRCAQAISVVSVAVVAGFAEAARTAPLTDLRIALGAVDAVIVRAAEAEAYGRGRVLDAPTRARCGQLAAAAAHPQDDVRGSAAYRRAMIAALVRRALEALARGEERAGWTERPVMLWGDTRGVWPVRAPAEPSPAAATVNGQVASLPARLSLLDGLRAAGHHEVKKGCAEGECGSCTVFLDGMAVLSCLIPAERARGSQVVTASGLAPADELHPLQEAFVAAGSVQCGYCIPGFIMSGAKLLEERPAPTWTQAQEAYMGNLCRCTGYAKILEATMTAGRQVRA